MTDVLCAHCERPVPDRLPLCHTCGENLVDTLQSVPSLVANFAVTRAGLARIGSYRVGSRSSGQPLPIRSAAPEPREDQPEPRIPAGRMVGDTAYSRLENTVTTWARVIAEHLGVEIPIGAPGLVVLAHNNRGHRRDRTTLPITPATSLEQAAVWLACHPHELRSHEAAGEMLAEIEAATVAISRTIDRPAELRYLGPCPGVRADGQPCRHELRVERGETWVRCPICRTQHDVDRIIAELRAAVEDELRTLADIVRLLPGLAAAVPRSTVYRWAKERRLEPRGWQHRDERGIRITDHRIDDSDAQVYRLGDAMTLATREHRKGGSAA